MKLPTIVFGTALFGLLFASSATAKCPFATYQVRIAVRDFCTKQPLEGATLVLFANDQHVAVDLRDPDDQPIRQLLTGTSGMTDARFWFSTDDGRSHLFGEQCTGRLRNIQVVVLANGYDQQRQTASVSIDTIKNGVQQVANTVEFWLFPSAGHGSCYIPQEKSKPS